MLSINDIPEDVVRKIVAAYHRRLEASNTEAQEESVRHFQRVCHMTTALTWLSMIEPKQPAVHPWSLVPDWFDEAADDFAGMGAAELEADYRYRAKKLRELMAQGKTAPAVADDVARDAKRYRFVREQAWVTAGNAAACDYVVDKAMRESQGAGDASPK